MDTSSVGLVLVSMAPPLGSVKVTSIEVSAVLSSMGALSSGAARRAGGAGGGAPEPAGPKSKPGNWKSVTEKDCMWNPLTGSIVNVASPPMLKYGLPLL